MTLSASGAVTLPPGQVKAGQQQGFANRAIPRYPKRADGIDGFIGMKTVKGDTIAAAARYIRYGVEFFFIIRVIASWAFWADSAPARERRKPSVICTRPRPAMAARIPTMARLAIISISVKPLCKTGGQTGFDTEPSCFKTLSIGQRTSKKVSGSLLEPAMTTLRVSSGAVPYTSMISLPAASN